ncbi:MAG: BTAD domain-containing putative transcriptional regulator, partial [Alphaproteobacteria bacterium]
MPVLLLGGFAITDVSAAPQHLPTKKAELAVAALALAGPGGLTRGALAEWVWPDRSEAQAKSSLRQALTAVRRKLPMVLPGCELHADRTSLTLTGPDESFDVRAFAGLEESQAAGDMHRAADLYGGDLLAGVDLPQQLGTWVAPQRENFRHRALTLVERMSALDSLSPAAANACENLANRLLSVDPAAEAAHRAIMRLRVAAGQTNAARRQLELCVTAVREELGVEVETATLQLGERLSDVGSTSAAPPLPVEGASPRAGRETDAVLSNPAVLVLPLENYGGEAAEDYFARGMTDDIIVALSNWRWFPVIGPNAVLAAADAAGDLRTTAALVGARYVLSGNVRRAAGRVRVGVQLVDAASGHTIWAQRYDRSINDVFALQDEISEQIVAQVEPQLQ